MMKKLLPVFLLLIFTLSLTAFAADTDFVEENEFVIASYNGINTFIKAGKNANELEDSTFWLIDNKDTYNLKYVSFIGRTADRCKYTHANVIAAGLGDSTTLNTLSLNDPVWNEQYSGFAYATGTFKEAGIPMGVGIAFEDYVGTAYNRTNLVEKYFPVDEIMPESADYDSYDNMNYYTIVENNGTKYMIFQLELWPRAKQLDWFLSLVNANPDKYIIVYTPSFIDDNGDMYTMWDWAEGFKTIGTTTLKSYNIVNSGRPRDGVGVWNYAFSSCDNLLAVVSQKVTVGDIVTSKVTNPNGIEVATIAANADVSVNSKGPTVLLTKFSQDNTEITCAWSTAFKGIDESSITTIKLNKVATLAEADGADGLPSIPSQYNGANKAYIFGKGENKFEPQANMTRAEACTIFARLLLGTDTIPDGYTTRFTDVKESDWFYNAVAYLDQTGFFYRIDKTTYNPNGPITRAEFVELANLSSNLAGSSKVTFTDVPADHFYYDAIIAAASSGLVNGYEDRTFRPDNTITRAEVVTVINRLLGLKVSEKTVDTSKLENEFSDISNHWARLNILMASNSNVHGEYYYNASLNGVRETSSNYIFKNAHFSFTVSKKTGKVTEFINLYTGDDINANLSSPQFIYLLNDDGNKVVPKALETDGNRIKVTFRDGSVVYMLVEIYDNFMTFEIDSELPSGIKSVTFAQLTTNLTKAESDDSFMLNSIGMSAWTNPVNKGYLPHAYNTLAHAYSFYDAGTMGAKLGIVFSKKADAIDYLKEVMDAIDPSVGLTSKAGGAYALDWEGNYGDYAIIEDFENLNEMMEMAAEIGVEQLDIHQGANKTFSQGDFVFAHTENGTAKEYYEKFGKKMSDAGFVTSLHTYSFYVSPSAYEITTNPKWQKQLETLETYTLRKNMSRNARNAATEESAVNFNASYDFFQKNTAYVLIDEEIIRVGKGTSSGFINLTRGTCGTTATIHKKGATIYHLSGYFGMFTPVLGNELFYHIADLTAKTYNEGGFDMIYFDAIDGLTKHYPSEEHEGWYYLQMFIHRVISQCERTPTVETSWGSPSEWNVRGRYGAWDYAQFSIKKHIKNHISGNKTSMEYNANATLGWFSFFPDENPNTNTENTIGKTLFHDDLDVLGIGNLIYNMTMVYHPLDIESVKSNPFHYANIMYYQNMYARLRDSGYFDQSVIDRVKAVGGEWRVVEKSEGEYTLQQMSYTQANLGNSTDTELNTMSGSNPYSAQMPFIRIESRYSTLFENPVTVAEFDDTKTLGEQELTKTLSTSNLKNTLAMTVRVKGTGKEGDAALISLSGGVTGESGGHSDYFIDLNFEGWREIILLDSENAQYNTSKYKFSGITTSGASYSLYRFIPEFTTLKTMKVRLCGDTAKNAMFGDVTAYTHTEAPVKNPTVTVGSTSVTFNCEMKGGEYLEYDPVTNKAILYHNAEQTTEEVSFTGNLSVPEGIFNAAYTAEALTAAPVRARLTLGFIGEELKNS